MIWRTEIRREWRVRGKNRGSRGGVARFSEFDKRINQQQQRKGKRKMEHLTPEYQQKLKKLAMTELLQWISSGVLDNYMIQLVSLSSRLPQLFGLKPQLYLLNSSVGEISSRQRSPDCLPICSSRKMTMLKKPRGLLICTTVVSLHPITNLSIAKVNHS